MDKWQATGSVRVENVYDVILNISLVMVIAGAVVFVVSFAGCVGALRENTCLLKFVSINRCIMFKSLINVISNNLFIIVFIVSIGILFA